MSQTKEAPANLVYLGGSVIVAVMFLAVFIGGANAGDFPRSKSADPTSVETYLKLNEKAEVEA